MAGIGFTISIFVTTLVFAGTAAADSAKIGIAIGSFVSAVGGLLILKRAKPAS
ncbi:MAG: Na+/H+ antiporter NhaA [Acidaminococcaceae bacterium]